MSLLDTLTTPLTVDEVRAAIYTAVEARGAKTTSWKPGSVVRTVITGVSIVLASVSSLVALVAESGFLRFSSGSWLTLVASEVYGTDRIAATFATGDVEISNSGASVYAIAPGDLVLSNSTTGATYRNTATANIGAGASGVVVPIIADEAGADSSANATDIDSFVTPLIGLTVTNPAAILGVDEESDEDLKTRAQAFASALSPNGPADAYRYFASKAVRAADGSAIGVTRIKTTADGSGGVALVVATATGAVTGTEGDPATDLGAVHLNVETNAVPLGITLSTASASTATQAVTAELWVREAYAADDAAIESAVDASLNSFFSTLPIGGVDLGSGGTLYLQAIETAITDAIDSGNLLDLNVITPAADSAVGASDAVTAGAVTLTINRVAV